MGRWGQSGQGVQGGSGVSGGVQGVPGTVQGVLGGNQHANQGWPTVGPQAYLKIILVVVEAHMFSLWLSLIRSQADSS